MINIIPRSTIGVPTPPSSRPRHPVPCRHLLVHYVGAGTYGDGRRVDTVEATAIARYGVNVGKPWEYNYLVGWQGHVYEQAGEFVGQHCLNFNSPSIGVLLMLGIGVMPSGAMIDAFRQLREQLPLHSDHEVVPHYRYRATPCCAQAAEPRGVRWASPTGEGYLGDVIPELLEPWTPPPAYQEDDDMPTHRWRDTRFANVFVEPQGSTVTGKENETLDEYPLIVEMHNPKLESACWRAWGCTRSEAEARGLLQPV